MNRQLDGWMHEWIFCSRNYNQNFLQKIAWKFISKVFWKMDEDLDGRMHECMKGSIDGWLKGIAKLFHGWNSYNKAQVDTDEMNRSANG